MATISVLRGLVWQIFLSSSLILPPFVVLGQNKIINGTSVNPPHKFPWVVSLFFAGCFSSGACPKPQTNCGGAILNEHYVITAAHCCFVDPSIKNVTSTKGLYVLTGLHELNKLHPWSQNLSIAECIPHELYKNGEDGIYNDIALIRVNGRIQFNDKVSPTNLPPSNFDVNEDEEATAILVGWGNTNASSFEPPKELQQTEVPLLTTDTCQRIYGLYKFYRELTSDAVTESMLCLGYGRKETGSCTGDSGGPAMMLNPKTKTYTQIGITSWGGRPCASQPAVCTRLSSYVDWINHHLQKCKPRTLNSTRHA